MRSVDPGKDFQTWREAARIMLGEGIPLEEILWEAEAGLFAPAVMREETPINLKVPAAFVEMAQSIACHRDPTRWGLLYRILWRITRGGEKHLPGLATDPDIAKARLLEKAVRREIHKMHAFVRFRLIDTDPATGRERYAAWFEPDHFIVEAGATFFKKRFANMDWSIFNPARLKVKMMQTEMPKRYWKNLPEAELIDELIEGSKRRVNDMLAEEPRPVKPRPKNAYLDKLRDLSAEETGG